jgi:hypothetical protein
MIGERLTPPKLSSPVLTLLDSIGHMGLQMLKSYQEKRAIRTVYGATSNVIRE